MFGNKEVKYEVGETPGAGIYKCTLCGKEVEIKDGEELKPCTRCHHKKFHKIS